MNSAHSPSVREICIYIHTLVISVRKIPSIKMYYSNERYYIAEFLIFINVT